MGQTTPGRALTWFIVAAGAALAVGCSPGRPPAPEPIPPPAVTAPDAPISDRSSYPRAKYNRIYSQHDQSVFTLRPSAFMMECVGRLGERAQTARRAVAVDLGAGQGRNAIPLAEAGYSVVAIDLSRVGLERARAAGAERGLDVSIIEAEVSTVEFTPDTIDLVAAIYFPVTEALVERLKPAVRPGGAIVIEGLPGDAQPGGTPLPDRFPGWRIIVHETVEVVPDWDWRLERRPVPVVRFFAVKPTEP